MTTLSKTHTEWLGYTENSDTPTTLIVVINLPGYLPESEPVPCIDLDDAHCYITTWLDELWDSAVQSGTSTDEADAHYQPLMDAAYAMKVNDCIIVDNYYVAIEPAEDDQ